MSHRAHAALVAALTGALLTAGCGSSSKPAYCTQVSSLEKSVETLEKAEVTPSNLSAISADVQQVATNTKELASAVQGEFAPQISAVKSSVSTLEGSLKGVANAPSSSTLSHAASVVPAQIEAVKHATNEVQEVTSSKCE